MSDIVGGRDLVRDPEVFLNCSAEPIVLVEDVRFELPERVLVSLGIQTPVLSSRDVLGEDGVDAVVHIGLVVELVRDQVDGL